MLKLFVKSFVSVLCVIACFSAQAHDIGVNSQRLLVTTHAWNDFEYASYPTGKPEISMLKVKVQPHSQLQWHTHPIISGVYILSGVLTLEDKRTGMVKVFKAGDAFGDTVNLVHRGSAGDEPVEMIVFFAGSPGIPLRNEMEEPNQ